MLWKGTVSAEFRAIRLKTKFSHQKIKWNFGILRSVSCLIFWVSGAKKLGADLEKL